MHMIKRSKGNEKSTVLPVRPAAPTLEEIHSDIQQASKDDFVFTSGQNFSEYDNLDASWNDDKIAVDDGSDAPDLKTFLKVEEQYKKILKFIQLHDNLKAGQIELNDSSATLARTRELVEAEKKDLEKKFDEQRELFKSS